MKKKILILIIVGLCIICSFLIFLLNRKSKDSSNMSKEERQKVGYEIFGDDFCKGHNKIEMAGQAITNWKCRICGYSDTHHNTATPVICPECASATGRCEKCGKFN